MHGANHKDLPTEPFAVPVGQPDHQVQAQIIPPLEVADGPLPPTTSETVQANPAVPMPKLPPIPTGEANVIADGTAKLAAMLVDAELTIAVAESLTGGGVAAELVRVPGISESFQGGIVAYQFSMKTKLLGVEQDLLAANGAVHPEVALQMARGVREACSTDDRGVDIGVSTTGVAGPDPADGHPAGTVYIGISSLWGERAVKLDFANLVRDEDPVGSRQRIRQATVEAAVFNVLDHLIENADDEQ